MKAAQILTAEEMSILSIYTEETREKVLDRIYNSLPHIDDYSIRKSAENAAAKLMDMSDEDFSELVVSEEV
ncbi:MAG: transposon-transfer assisting family protein [Oscillospiraceae bacterium]|nr:transposon-transfer assisting family protein [Oscillospiraceae bacterium]